MSSLKAYLVLCPKYSPFCFKMWVSSAVKPIYMFLISFTLHFSKVLSDIPSFTHFLEVKKKMSPAGRLGWDWASRHPLGLSPLGKWYLPSLRWLLCLASTPHTTSSSSQGDSYNTWASQHGTPSRKQSIIKQGMNLILDSWARAWSKIVRDVMILWGFLSISSYASAGELRYSLRANLTITMRVKAWTGQGDG